MCLCVKEYEMEDFGIICTKIYDKLLKKMAEHLPYEYGFVLMYRHYT